MFSISSSSYSSSSYTDDEEIQREAEMVEGRRVNGSTVQYLVKWKGLSDGENTWEDEDELIKDGNKQLITDFLEGKKKVVDSVPGNVRIEKGTPFEILKGFKCDGQVYYRVRFENGIVSDLRSGDVLTHDGSQLVKFLESKVEMKPMT